MRDQAQKAAAFRALHERDGAFIIPNPWDVGTARLLAHLGFEALATTSAGYAFSVGKRDNAVGRADMMEHVRAIVSATDLPVSADLENGFGDDPETVAETLRQALDAGLAGASIEDSTGRPDNPLYERELASEARSAPRASGRGAQGALTDQDPHPRPPLPSALTPSRGVCLRNPGTYQTEPDRSAWYRLTSVFPAS